MTVDFVKPAHLLVVHGVQSGTDADIDSSEQLGKLVKKSLARSHINREFESIGFYYEDINDEAQRFYRLLGKALTNGKPLTGRALQLFVDAAGDIVTATSNSGTARKIRRKLHRKILDSYASGNQLLLVSHSLGSVYALDTISELIGKEGLFEGDDRATWPVQGLITMGSPLGLELDILGKTVFARRKIEPLSALFDVFPWHNFFNRLDPVVSGDVFGRPLALSGSQGPVERRYGEATQQAQWLLQGHAVSSGKQWLLAHNAYWKNPRIGDRIVDILWG